MRARSLLHEGGSPGSSKDSTSFAPKLVKQTVVVVLTSPSSSRRAVGGVLDETVRFV